MSIDAYVPIGDRLCCHFPEKGLIGTSMSLGEWIIVPFTIATQTSGDSSHDLEWRRVPAMKPEPFDQEQAPTLTIGR